MAAADYAGLRLGPCDMCSTVRLIFFDDLGQTQVSGIWGPGLYFTDGSGGRYGGHASLRRCGMGIAVCNFQSFIPALLWRCASKLLGSLQTVPRSELFALTLIVVRVRGGDIEVVVDNKWVVDTAIRLSEVGLAGLDFPNDVPHSDLWRTFLCNISSKNLWVRVRWTKSHVSAQDLQNRDLSLFDTFGNAAAEALAEVGARKDQVDKQDAAAVLDATRAVRLIQRRAVAILQFVAEGKKRHPMKQPAVARPTVAARIAASEHQLVCVAGKASCTKCV